MEWQSVPRLVHYILHGSWWGKRGGENCLSAPFLPGEARGNVCVRLHWTNCVGICLTNVGNVNMSAKSRSLREPRSHHTGWSVPQTHLEYAK